MQWRDEWTAIGGRIDGLLAAGQFFIQALQVNSGDSFGGAKQFAEQAKDVVAKADSFVERYSGLLPSNGEAAIRTFLETQRSRIEDRNVKGVEGLKLRLIALALLKSEVDFHFQDFEAIIRTQSERAFVHLQQLIVADQSVGERWLKAFGDGEIACERLGGAHLLHHGIFAFKVSAQGARTDLVFGEPVESDGRIQRLADGIVLTEWKLIRDMAKASEAAAGAVAQAQMYATGVLGGLELRTYRYVVLVSMDRLPALNDASIEGVIYRHVNVAVAPSVPSRAA